MIPRIHCFDCDSDTYKGQKQSQGPPCPKIPEAYLIPVRQVYETSRPPYRLGERTLPWCYHKKHWRYIDRKEGVGG